MQNTERTKQPGIQSIETIHIPSANRFRLSNNIPVYSIHSGTEEIVKIDLLFRAGNWFSPNPSLQWLPTKCFLKAPNIIRLER